MHHKSIVWGIGLLMASPFFTACGSSPGNRDDLKPAAYQLEGFSTCDDLLNWQIDRNLDNVGPEGWQFAGNQYYDMREDTAAPNAADKAEGQSSSATGTNTQEADVDEPDFAKTNGQIVVSARDNEVVITDVTGTTPREIGRYSFAGAPTFPTCCSSATMSLSQPISRWQSKKPHQVTLRSSWAQRHHLHNLDISHPSAPELVWTRSYSGSRSPCASTTMPCGSSQRRAARREVHLSGELGLVESPQGSCVQPQDLAGRARSRTGCHR
ncbi:MAG: beta-propeller domain-containing protein [Marmoricola sp.]